MKHIWLSMLSAVAALGTTVACAQALDVDIYSTRTTTSIAPSTPVLAESLCPVWQPGKPLELRDVIELAICSSPQTREAWANARTRAAAVGEAKAAYLPTLSLQAGIERDSLTTTYGSDAFSISQTQQSTSRYGVLNLNWVLFDFGQRGARLREAQQLLAAANAAQDATLQTVFFSAAQAYYGVLDAKAAVAAATDIEEAAKESLDDANGLYQSGAGDLSDQLQARTNFRRAVLDRVNAQEHYRAAVGTLAVTVGLAVDTPVSLPVDAPLVDRQDFSSGIDQLLELAKRQNPALIAARAKWDAARSHIVSTQAEDLPSIALTGTVSRNNPSYESQGGVMGSHGNTVGIQITIPIFDGFSVGYQVAQAKAQADAKKAELDQSELQVSLGVWERYASLHADTFNLDTSKELLDDAKKSLDIARGRYKSGVGSITELLNAQSSLADARKQRVIAISKWRTDRLQLAQSLGNLRLW